MVLQHCTVEAAFITTKGGRPSPKAEIMIRIRRDNIEVEWRRHRPPEVAVYTLTGCVDQPRAWHRMHPEALVCLVPDSLRADVESCVYTVEQEEIKVNEVHRTCRYKATSILILQGIWPPRPPFFIHDTRPCCLALVLAYPVCKSSLFSLPSPSTSSPVRFSSALNPHCSSLTLLPSHSGSHST